jgi:hypothetical protein
MRAFAVFVASSFCLGHSLALAQTAQQISPAHSPFASSKAQTQVILAADKAVKKKPKLLCTELGGDCTSISDCCADATYCSVAAGCSLGVKCCN